MKRKDSICVRILPDQEETGTASILSEYTVKSVQSTLSHLQSPPEQMQSQHNYGSFLSKSHIHGMILLTMLAPNRPKVKDNALIDQFAFSRSSISKRGNNCDMFEITLITPIKVCSINFEPPDNDLCSACYVFPTFSWSMNYFNSIYIE